MKYVRHTPNIGKMIEKISLGTMGETQSKNGFVEKSFLENMKIWAEKVDETYEKEEKSTKVNLIFCIRSHSSFFSQPYVSYKNVSYEIIEKEIKGDYAYISCQGVI